MVPLDHIIIPINIAKSIVRNKPEDVSARLMQTEDKKPVLIVGGLAFFNITKFDKRFMRGPDVIDSYVTRGFDDKQFLHSLVENPVVLKKIASEDQFLYEIVDGAHRIERAIWLGLETIPAAISSTQFFD